MPVAATDLRAQLPCQPANAREAKLCLNPSSRVVWGVHPSSRGPGYVQNDVLHVKGSGIAVFREKRILGLPRPSTSRTTGPKFSPWLEYASDLWPSFIRGSPSTLETAEPSVGQHPRVARFHVPTWQIQHRWGKCLLWIAGQQETKILSFVPERPCYFRLEPFRISEVDPILRTRIGAS